MPPVESIAHMHERQDKELRIRNNPLSLYPQTLDNLLDHQFPPTRWIVDGLLPREGITIMSATPGSFKTWMLLEIALRVTQQQKLFGQFDTQQGGVLIVDEESGARMLNERFRQLNAPRGLPITYFSRAGHKVNQEYIDSLISVCLANSISLIIFDSLVRLHQGDENTSKDMAELFSLFKQLTDHDIAVLIAHHNRKGVPGAYNPSSDMRGSSDILAAVDCHMALNRPKNSDYVDVWQTKNRYTREVAPFKLRFVETNGKSEFQFIESMRTKDDERTDIKEAVLRLLGQEPGMTKKLLLTELNRTGVDVKNGALGSLLGELAADGHVQSTQGLRNAVHYHAMTSSSATKS